MKKQPLRLLSLLMALVLLTSAFPPNGYTAYAQARSDPYYQNYGIGLSRNGDGSLHINFHVTAKRTSDMIGVTFYRVQRKYNDSWISITDYTEGTLFMNTAFCAFARDFDEAVSGVRYRVYARFYIRDYDGTVAEIDYYSQSFTMP